MPTLNLPVDELRELARTIRHDVLVAINAAKSGHPGGPLSAADYLTALWMNYLSVDPENPYWEERDRFVLSNGHCSALNYALMAHRGFFNRGYLLTFRRLDSRLQGHPSRASLPGIEVSSGSLGQGLSVAVGMAVCGTRNGSGRAHTRQAADYGVLQLRRRRAAGGQHLGGHHARGAPQDRQPRMLGGLEQRAD